MLTGVYKDAIHQTSLAASMYLELESYSKDGPILA